MSLAVAKVLRKLQEPDERSNQFAVGPSELGGCPKCLAYRLEQKLTGEFIPSESSYPAWLGTMVHKGLEETLGLGTSERKVFVYHLEGYGDISGHIDLTLDGEVIDYKVVGQYSYRKMQSAYRSNPRQIPTVGYRSQQHCYAYGLNQAGETVEQVNLLVFPKHKNDWSDVAVFEEYYNEEVALRTFERLEYIWELVQQGKIADIPSDGDCYTCSNNTRIIIRK